MIDILFSSPTAFIIIFGGLLAAITVHEFAHAWTADKLGDPTPRAQGRVTLDPRAHLDPVGTLAILLTRFGWGRPVEFDPYNLKEPIRDTAIIALAGPASNLLFASILSAAIYLLPLPGLLALAFVQVIYVNVILAVFNLVPVYPLDGSKFLMAILPPEAAYEYEQIMHRYGIFILLFLILPWGGVSPISQLISPIISLIAGIFIP